MMAKTLGITAYIDGVGLLGAGLPNWTLGRAVLARIEPYVERPVELPVATALPPAERRRVGASVKLVLAVGVEAATAAGRDPAHLATVFTSSGADGDNCHEICQMLATGDRQISPTRFHNSVHNAPAGYWSIATGAMQPSTSLCAFDGSFGAGLLEAYCQVLSTRQPVLLIAYDTGYPEPLHHSRPMGRAFGVALLLSTECSAVSMGRADLEITTENPTSLESPALEALRLDSPAGRALPLLELLARRQAGRQTLAYLDHLRLAVTLTPCH